LLTLPFTTAPAYSAILVTGFLAVGGLLVLAGLETLRRLRVEVYGPASAA
jgi:hypothetical protein